MTKYRLKDQELQKKLDDLSDGDFSRQLNEESLDGCSPDFTFRVRFGGQVGTCFRYSAVFRVDEIMIQEGYDPNAWNKFPEVTPPENIPMRVEFIWNDGARGKCCGVYRNGVWLNSEDRDCEIENVKRFRPRE